MAISWILKLMLNNSKSDTDTQDGHMCNGILFRKIPLMNPFKQIYGPLAQNEGFYGGEESELSNEEYSEFAREEEVETKEPRREEP
jgi:hypothetical protein